MYECESCTIKETECRSIDDFELWCWRRFLRVLWIARRSNQSILKKNNPEYSLEGLMLKLKLQYFGHLMQRANSLERTLMLGKIEGRRRGQQRTVDKLNGHEFEQALGGGRGHGSLACCSPWGHKELATTEQLNEERIQSTPHLQSRVSGWGGGVLSDTILNLAELQHGSILWNPPRISSRLKDSLEWWTNGILSTTYLAACNQAPSRRTQCRVNCNGNTCLFFLVLRKNI